MTPKDRGDESDTFFFLSRCCVLAVQGAQKAPSESCALLFNVYFAKLWLIFPLSNTDLLE
jgi:hypothetical protein